MLGSALVTLPWAFQQAGWLFSIILCFSSVLISSYTCSIIVKFTREEDDFQDAIFKYFGKKGWYIGVIASTAVIAGAHIGMFIVMSQLLYTLIMALYDWIAGG
jgi:amino acid permease